MSCNNLVAAAYLLGLHALISPRAGNSSFFLKKYVKKLCADL